MKRVFRVMLGLALLPFAVAFPLFAQTVTVIHQSPDSDPLTIYVANDLSAQIAYDQSKWQVSPSGQTRADSGFFVCLPDFGITYGPDFGSHPGGTSVDPTPIQWTEEFQSSDPDGNGSGGDPWTVITRVRGDEVRVQQIISYVNSEDEVNLSWTITNISGGELNYICTHAVAMYMQYDGNAFGFGDSATGAVGGYNQAKTWFEQLTPLSPLSDAFQVSDYGSVWGNILGDPPGLDDTINTNDYIPMAAGLQWNVNPLAAGDSTTITEKWQVGPNVPSIPTPTPPPTPQPTPGLVTTLNSTTLTAGDQFTVDVTVEPINQSFDAWAVIIGNGATYSMVLNNPAQIRGGLHPLITGVKRLASQFSGRLLDMQIPSGVTGTFQVIVALVPAGKQPSVRNAIPGYLDQKTVTVQ